MKYTLGEIIEEASDKAPEDYHEFNIEICLISESQYTTREIDMDFDVDAGIMTIYI